MTDSLQSQVKEIFDLFDKDRDGSVNQNELKDVISALGISASDEETKTLAKGGLLGFKDFFEFYNKKLKFVDKEADIVDAFKIFDKDNKGSIGKEELKHIITSLLPNINEKDIDEMLKEADLNGDGNINYADFVKIMMAQ